MSCIQIRIDEETKNKAKAVFDKLGVDLSTGIKIYLHQVIINQGIPLKLVTENGLTFDEEKSLLKDSKEAKQKKNITSAMELKEAITYLKKIS